MLTGFLEPTSGNAYVDGLDVRTNIDDIYHYIGVCPQQDILWDNLTGREHLLFYGRCVAIVLGIPVVCFFQVCYRIYVLCQHY